MRATSVRIRMRNTAFKTAPNNLRMLTQIYLNIFSLSSAGNLRGMGVRQVLQPQGRPARQVQTVAKQPLLKHSATCP
jgi:hypothetical protein